MDIKKDILNGREERAKLINEYLKEYKTVISVKANMPGTEKNSYISYLLINAFSFLIKEFESCEYEYKQNADGPFILILIKLDDSQNIKSMMTTIEDTHILGRLIDIDVYNNDGNISRKNKRKCILCEDSTYNCMKFQKHSYEELINYIESKTKEYYTSVLKNTIEKSILAELDLHPKFGLVTPQTSGSHNDMDYGLMIKAKDAIIPYFVEMFFASCVTNNKFELLQKLKIIGLKAETAMFSTTSGINAYKGLIFNLGLVVSSLGFKISRYNKENVFTICKDFANILLSEYSYKGNSFGDLAYRNYEIKGARGEALSGFEHVVEGIKILKDLSWTYKIRTLIYYIINIDDTSLLKRAKTVKKYFYIKEMFKKININDTIEFNKLNDYCIDNNISFGGSADLLVVSVFVKEMYGLSLGFLEENSL